MIQATIKVLIENGLHARPAGDLIKTLKPYKSDVYLIKDHKKINLKSIIQLMSIAIKENEELDIQINGEDEEEVLVVIETFFSSQKFY